MNCKKCGNQVDEKALFCSACGEAVEKEKLCRQCGKPIKDGHQFCEYCGEPVVLEEDGTRCPYCDKALPDSAKEFCPHCGCSLYILKEIEEWTGQGEQTKEMATEAEEDKKNENQPEKNNLESILKHSNLVPILFMVDIAVSIITMIVVSGEIYWW